MPASWNPQNIIKSFKTWAHNRNAYFFLIGFKYACLTSIRIKEQLSLFSLNLLSCWFLVILFNSPCNNARPVLVSVLAEATSPIFDTPFCQMQPGPVIKEWMSRYDALVQLINFKSYRKVKCCSISRNIRKFHEADISGDCVALYPASRYEKPSHKSLQMIELNHL